MIVTQVGWISQIEADIARHISGRPLPYVTRTGVAASRLEPPWGASRRQREHSGDARRTSTSRASVGVYDTWRQAGADSGGHRNVRGTNFRSLG
jgi:hypothetical protein